MRAQYLAGTIGDDEIPDYRKTEDVKPDSTTETYVALKLMIDNWRWAGVPFYLRTGKALGHKRTEVAIKFKQAPLSMFPGTAVDRLSQNFLTIGIAPTETIELQFNAKMPGPTHHHRRRRDEVPLQGLFPGRASDRLRDADLRLHDRRQHPVPARRRHRGGWQAVQPFLDAWKKAGSQRHRDL